MVGELTVWHGINRNEIDWFPVIDPDKCTGCGMCVVTCGEKRNVFGYDRKLKKAVVLNPDNCMVGCNNCQVSCLWNAISYPENTDYLRDLVRKLPDEVLERELKNKLETTPGLKF
ncbi:MAG: 4Fe-4S dicluster domain-containing protein [Thermoplasmatales archaeon]|nr:4Fe-4S dicluster domain-containing protein [Thermoplasmatales archaeon]